MIKLPFNVTRAKGEIIEALILSGVLYTDKNGLHVTNKKKIPCRLPIITRDK